MLLEKNSCRCWLFLHVWSDKNTGVYLDLDKEQEQLKKKWKGFQSKFYCLNKKTTH